MHLFEVGVIYKRGAKLFLAIANDRLLTFVHGKAVESRPKVAYIVARATSVDELCSSWGISSLMLDAATMRFLAPSQEGIKTQPRGSRRHKLDEEQLWQNIRTVRLSGSRG